MKWLIYQSVISLETQVGIMGPHTYRRWDLIRFIHINSLHYDQNCNLRINDNMNTPNLLIFVEKKAAFLEEKYTCPLPWQR
jgi:hypothetical protein